MSIGKLTRMEKGQVLSPDDEGDLKVNASGFTSSDGTKCDTHQKAVIDAMGGSRGAITHDANYSAVGQQQRATG